MFQTLWSNALLDLGVTKACSNRNGLDIHVMLKKMHPSSVGQIPSSPNRVIRRGTNTAMCRKLEMSERDNLISALFQHMYYDTIRL